MWLRASTYLLTTYNQHRHTTVSSSASHRTLHPTRLSTHAPVSGTDVDDRAPPTRPSSECLVVGYGSAAGWRCLPSHRHRILLITSYFLLLTSYFLLLTYLRLLWLDGGVCRGQGAGGVCQPRWSFPPGLVLAALPNPSTCPWPPVDVSWL